MSERQNPGDRLPAPADEDPIEVRDSGESLEEALAEEALAEEAFAEEQSTTSEEDIEALEPDLDGAVDHVEAVEVETDAEPVKAAVEVDDESQDALQRMREEFAARAKEAELRVKQREAELDEAASAPKSKS